MGIILFYTLFGFLILPYIIQSNFTSILKEKLNTNATIGKVTINPYTFEIHLDDLAILDDKEKNLLSFQKLYLDLKFLDLFKAEITLKELFINNLKSSIVLYEKDKFNFSHILEQLAKNSNKNEDTAKDDEKSSSLFFAIESFSLNNTKLSFEDTINQSKTATTIDNLSFALTTEVDNELHISLSNFDLQIPNVSYHDKRFDIKTVEFSNTIQKIEITQNKTLSYFLDTVVLKNKEILFQDVKKTDGKTLTLSNLMLSLDQFTNTVDEKNIINLSFDTPTKGNLSLSSDLILEPFSIDGNAKIEDLTIIPYKNYLKDFINLDIKSTDINTTASFKITENTQEIDANLTFSDVSLYHNISKEQLLDFDTLDIQKIHYTNNNLVIDKVILDTFVTQFKIKADASTNMDQLIVEDTTKQKEKIATEEIKKEQKSSFQYYIKSLELKNGKALYSDHQLPLKFDTNIHTLQAKLEDLSSKNEETTIRLKGVVEKYGVANIEAKSILSNFKDKTKVSVHFENLDVRSFSPYSGKFIGQKIHDGRLWLKLDYSINDAQLLSTNNIKLKNLTLGEDVESPEAMSLPVGLAIALLEDRDGLIDVDVPITGDMANPEFKLSGVIWKTLGNIITNVVTAPFSFLGSLLGLDSDELGDVEFAFASAQIQPPQKEKLDKLIGLLKQKEALLITLQGSYDQVKDSRVLKEKKFKQMIKSDNKEETITKLYIEKFGQEKYNSLSKDKNIDNLTATLGDEIKATIIISKNDLESLAKQRVQNLQEYFVSNKLRFDRIQIKDDIIENDSSSDEVFTLQLQLNIKDN